MYSKKCDNIIFPTNDPNGTDGWKDDPLCPPVNQIRELLEALTNKRQASRSRDLGQSETIVTSSMVKLVAGLMVTSAWSLIRDGCLSFNSSNL